MPKLPLDAPTPSSAQKSKLTGETEMRFRNPATGQIVVISDAFLWTLLFGPFYWAKHEAWLGFVVSVLAALATFGVSWLIAPFFARFVLRYRYLSNGWEEF